MCGTFNLLSTASDATCRGCQRPLRETNEQYYLEREMDAISTNAVETGRSWGWWVGIAIWYACGLLVREKGGTSFGTVVMVTLFAAAIGYVVFQVVRNRIRTACLLHGFADPSPHAEKFRWRDWQRTARRHQEQLEKNQKRTWSSGWGFWIFVFLGVGLLFVYPYFFSDYAQGYRKGVQDVRELNRQGLAARTAGELVNALDLIPTDASKSVDWNAGYRQGYKQELQALFPRRRPGK